YLGTFTSQSTRWTNRVECERGALCWGASEPLRVIHPGGSEATAERLPIDEDQPTREAQILDALYQYIVQGIEPDISGRNNLRTMQLVTGCITSTEEGRIVRF